MTHDTGSDQDVLSLHLTNNSGTSKLKLHLVFATFERLKLTSSCRLSMCSSVAHTYVRPRVPASLCVNDTTGLQVESAGSIALMAVQSLQIIPLHIKQIKPPCRLADAEYPEVYMDR